VGAFGDGKLERLKAVEPDMQAGVGRVFHRRTLGYSGSGGIKLIGSARSASRGNGMEKLSHSLNQFDVFTQ
jgi:hypothetical protein